MSIHSYSHVHTRTYIHTNSWGPIVPVSNHCPIRRLLAIGGYFKNLNPLSQQEAFAGHCPASRWYIIGGQWMLFAVYVYVSGLQSFSLETSQLTAFGSACWVFVWKLSSAREPNTLCNCCSCQTQSTTMCTYCSQMKMDLRAWVILENKAFGVVFSSSFSSPSFALLVPN